MGGELLTRCDELWVMGSAIFSGMREEMELAKKLYMPIFYVSDEMVQDKVKIRQQDRLLGLDDCVEGMRKFTTEIFDTGVALFGCLRQQYGFDRRRFPVVCP